MLNKFEYFQKALDTIVQIYKIVDEHRILGDSRPHEISFMEQWMADGFFVKFAPSCGTESKNYSFEVCGIWDNSDEFNIRVLGATIYCCKDGRRTFVLDTKFSDNWVKELIRVINKLNELEQEIMEEIVIHSVV